MNMQEEKRSFERENFLNYHLWGLTEDPFGLNCRPVYRKRAKLLETMLHKEASFASGVEHWVDICCGDGRLTEMFSKYAKVTHGLDGSSSLLSQAKRRKKNIEFKIKDLTKTSFEPDKQPCVVSFLDSIYYFSAPTQIRIIKEIHASQKDDGLLLISPMELMNHQTREEIFSLYKEIDTDVLLLPKNDICQKLYSYVSKHIKAHAVLDNTDDELVKEYLRYNSLARKVIEYPNLSRCLLSIGLPLRRIIERILQSDTLYNFTLNFGSLKISHVLLRKRPVALVS